MLVRSTFDENHFQLPCFRLHHPITQDDFDNINIANASAFIDAKLPVADLRLSRILLVHGFRKICTQVQLSHTLTNLSNIFTQAKIDDSLRLSTHYISSHASHFETSRFHQDILVPREIANSLYAQWIQNSLNGEKRVVHMSENFCTFTDKDFVRSIDLLSVLEKQKGIARALLETLLHDAESQGLKSVSVVTEAENVGAIATYKSVGFDIVGFVNVFHFYRPK